MSYQVIARKYRPQRFADVVGQEHVTQTLSNAIRQNRIAHAYLFVGPRGTGKTTIARIFSKCLNCVGGPKVEFAEDDPRCLEISEGRSMDVLEIDGASNRGIEEIRALRETVKYAPSSSKYKIYIIDEVHMLTKEAFNALLKTLEEPPEHVKFMFATTEPEKVLATILSRCQRYDLRRIPVAQIAAHLGQISILEKVQIEDAALYAIARGAEGCMRDAESTLDQLISFCGTQVVESDVLSMFGLAARGQIHDLAGQILAGNAGGALSLLNDLARNGKDLGRLLSDLLNHFRNLLLFAMTKGDMGLLEVTESEAALLKDHSTRCSVDGLTRIMEIMTECESRFRDAVSKKISVEVALIKSIQARNAMNLETVLQYLQQLKAETPGMPAMPAISNSQSAAFEIRETAARVIPVTASPAFTSVAAPQNPPSPVKQETVRHPVAETKPSVTPVVPAAPLLQPVVELPLPKSVETAAAPVVKEQPAAIVPGGESLDTLWSRIMDAVGQASPFTKSYLIQAYPVSLSNRVFTIGFAPENVDQLGLVDNKKNRELIETKLSEQGYLNHSVRFIKAEPAADRLFTLPAELPGAVGQPSVSHPSPSVVPELSFSQKTVASPAAHSVPTATPAKETNKQNLTVPPRTEEPAASKPAHKPAPQASPSPQAAQPAAAEKPKQALVQLSKEEFKNDPLIKEALEIFKGQIVEVLGNATKP